MQVRADPAFAAWVRANLVAHKQPGYAIVNLSLKAEGEPPGDATASRWTRSPILPIATASARSG